LSWRRNRSRKVKEDGKVKGDLENSNPISRIDPFGLSSTDNFYGLPSEFWNWAHDTQQLDKLGAGQQISREEALRLRDIWNGLGRPGPDSKGVMALRAVAFQSMTASARST
jgi:hypothetical protein